MNFLRLSGCHSSVSYVFLYFRFFRWKIIDFLRNIGQGGIGGNHTETNKMDGIP